MADLYSNAAQGLLSASQTGGMFGQQTNTPYWGDLSSQGYQAGDYKKLGIRELVKQAAQRLGYTGTIAGGAGPQDLNELAGLLGMSGDQLAQMQGSMGGAWMKDGDTSKRDGELTNALRQQYADQEVYNWLTGQGYKVNTFDNGREVVQQLVSPNGEMVTVDAHNYINDNKAVRQLGAIGALMVGGAAAIGGVGGAAGGAGATGGATSGGISSGLTTGANFVPTVQALPTGMTAGMTGGTGIAGYVPTAAQAFGGAAGAGGISTLGGGTANFVPTAQALPSGAQMTAGMTGGTGITGYVPTAAEAFGGGIATLGNGSATYKPTVQGLPSGAEMTQGMTGGTGVTGSVPSLGGGGLLDTLKNFGGSVVDQFTSDPNAAKNWAGLLGGVAGAMEGGKDQTATTQQKIDPRMAQYLYGTGYGDPNSMLGAAQQWFQNNRSGMNANMQQGLDTLKNLYTSPGYTQGYTQMRDVGQGLLGRPIAGNPFTQGGLLGAPIQQAIQQPIQAPPPDIGVPPPTMQRPPVGLLQGQAMPSPDIGIQQIKRPWSI